MALMILLFCLCGFGASYKTYNGYKILRIHLTIDTDREVVEHLMSSELLNVVSEPRTVHVQRNDDQELRTGLRHVNVLVSPGNLAICQQILRSHDVTYKVQVRDLGEQISREKRAAPDIAKFSYDEYHKLDVIYAHLNELQEKHPTKAQVFNLPDKTYEGRNITVIRLTANVTEGQEKPMIWIDGGIHAREWVSPATVMYIVDSLLGEEEMDKTDTMSALLEKFQFVIAPCINPDGYVYTHTHDRLWRKTRAPAGCKKNKTNWFGGCFYELCYGIDANRNFDVQFNTVGVSPDPCNNMFPGKVAFDQRNTAAVRNFLLLNQANLTLYLSYHSYSQYFMTPLGYTHNTTLDDEHHRSVGEAVVRALNVRHNRTYTAGSWSEILYLSSGNSADWVYEKLNITDSYTIELRPGYPDSTETEFELPAEEIRPCAEENVDGLIALIENIKYSRGNKLFQNDS